MEKVHLTFQPNHTNKIPLTMPHQGYSILSDGVLAAEVIRNPLKHLLVFVDLKCSGENNSRSQQHHRHQYGRI